MAIHVVLVIKMENKRNDDICMEIKDKPTDMEVVMKLMQLIDATPGIRIQGIVELAENALKTMINPLAKEILKHKLLEK